MKHSAGILLYTRKLDVLLVHPGGPHNANKDKWSIPKGEFDPQDELPYDAAIREFHEETGFTLSKEDKPFFIGSNQQSPYKTVHVFALCKYIDVSEAHSNTFKMEWDGVLQEFPEVDLFEWFSFEEAKLKIHPGQRQFLEVLHGCHI